MPRKDPGRKAALKSNKRTVDDDLIELASVIAEYQLDNNAYGWFRPSWRDGDNAAKLAMEVGLAVCNIDVMKVYLVEVPHLVNQAARDNVTYERAGQLYNELIQPKINTISAGLFAAALRCLQLKISSSHGGGNVYNELLIQAFLPLDPSPVFDYVLEARCKDAIGTTHHLQGDRNDRQRAAFTIAWKRGLYLAAYSLPPAF